MIPAQTATPLPAINNATIANPGQAATPPPAAGPATPATAGTTGSNQASVPVVPPGNISQVYGAQNRGARVVLRARNDTRITVRAEDGTLYMNRDLKAGDTYQVPNTPGLFMAIKDGASVEVLLDGLSLGRAGQTQQVLGRVALDPQSLVDRFNSR